MRLLSLAAGTIPEIGPAEMIDAAARGGWPAVGLWFDPQAWTAASERAVVSRLAATGLVALDMEPIFITEGADHGDALIDAAAAVGVANILVVGRKVAPARLADRLGELSRRAAGAGIALSLEFGPLFANADLASALATIEAAAEPNLAVLVDALHLARSGGVPADLAVVAPERLRYAQICDAPSALIGDLRTDALDGRSLPGDGELPVADFIAALPADLPLSAEIRSAPLRTAYPDPVERARVVWNATLRAVSGASADHR